jgi:hypothetical protein
MANKKKIKHPVSVGTLIVKTQEGVTFETLAGLCFLLPTPVLIQRHNELLQQQTDCTYVHALCVQALIKVIRGELKNRGYKDAASSIQTSL